jgi:hypothetical protein
MEETMNTLRKVGIVAALVGMITSAAIIDRIPLEMLTWVQAAVNDPDYLRVLQGDIVEHEGKPVAHVFPIPGRMEWVCVVYEGQDDWAYVTPARLMDSIPDSLQ